MPDPVFSVIISTHNRKDLLARAIRSVLGQTFRDLELLVIDNGSTDGTEFVVTAIKDPRIRFVKNPRPTASCDVPRNIGIKMARGRYIAFLDDDDIWYPERLEKVKNAFVGNPDVSAVCHHENLTVNGAIKKVLRHGPFSEDLHERLLYERNCLSSCGTTLRADVFGEVGVFNEREEMSEVADYDFWIRMARTGARVYFIEEPLGEFSLTGNNWSVVNPRFGWKQASMIKGHIMEHEKRRFFNLSRRGAVRLLYLYLIAGKSSLTAAFLNIIRKTRR